MKHALDVNVLLAAIWQSHPDFARQTHGCRAGRWPPVRFPSSVSSGSDRTRMKKTGANCEDVKAAVFPEWLK